MQIFCIFLSFFLKKKKTLLRQYSLGGHLRGPLHFLPFFLLFFFYASLFYDRAAEERRKFEFIPTKKFMFIQIFTLHKF